MMKRMIICLLLISSASWSVAAELSQYAANKALKANQLAQENKLSQAIETLRTADVSRAYDKAYFSRMLGVFYWQNEQLKPAITALEQAVESGELKDDQGWLTERMLADLLLMNQQYKQALPHYYQLSKKIPTTENASELWLRIAQVHYQMEQWQKTLAAISEYDKFKQPDSVTPLSVKLGAQLQLERWEQAIPTLKKLINLEPQRSNWWLQLVNLELRTGKKKDALSSLGLAQLQKIELSDADLRLLAQLYAHNGIPERAGLVLEHLKEAQTNVDLITERAYYWQQAKEWDKAIDTWALAAKFDGKYHWNIAQILMQQARYDDALSELDNVKEKGKQAQVALARTKALYKLNQLEPALIEAKKANNLEPSEEAKSWIKYLTQLRKVKDNQTS